MQYRTARHLFSDIVIGRLIESLPRTGAVMKTNVIGVVFQHRAFDPLFIFVLKAGVMARL